MRVHGAMLYDSVSAECSVGDPVATANTRHGPSSGDNTDGLLPFNCWAVHPDLKLYGAYSSIGAEEQVQASSLRTLCYSADDSEG